MSLKTIPPTRCYTAPHESYSLSAGSRSIVEKKSAWPGIWLTMRLFSPSSQQKNQGSKWRNQLFRSSHHTDDDWGWVLLCVFDCLLFQKWMTSSSSFPHDTNRSFRRFSDDFSFSPRKCNISSRETKILISMSALQSVYCSLALTDLLQTCVSEYHVLFSVHLQPQKRI